MASGYFGFAPGTAQFTYSNAGTYAAKPAAAPTFVAYPSAAVQAYSYTPVATAPIPTYPAGYPTAFQTTPIVNHTEYIAPAAVPAYVPYARPPTVTAYYTPPTLAAAPPTVPVLNKTLVNVNVSPVVTTTSTTYTGYDAAIYAAASSILHSKSVTNSTNNAGQWLGLKRSQPTFNSNKNSALTTLTGGGNNNSSTNNNSSLIGGTFNKTTFGSNSNNSQNSNNFIRRRIGVGFSHTANHSRSTLQTFYCDVCKISCAGQLTYKEHVDGQKHKKKEAQVKSGQQPAIAKTKTTYKCDICGVTCTGHDTYLAHARGVKHQKTLKLHLSMGKPMSSTAPIIIPPSHPLKVLTPGDGSDIKASEPLPVDEDGIPIEKDVEPVGADYIEPQKDDEGKLNAYFCKLCDCKFNDVNAKDMHLKGRRHRLQFKKKVNPDLEVDVKLTPKMRRQNEERSRRELLRQRQLGLWNMRMYRSTPMLPPPIGLTTTGPVPLFGPNTFSKQTVMRGETVVDKYLLAKHSTIYLTEDENSAIQRVVGNIEKALKMVSDTFAERDNETEELLDDKIKKEIKSEEEPTIKEEKATTTNAPSGPPQTAQPSLDDRILKGVMRVGDLAKQLVLRGDLKVNLVVLCATKPTAIILRDVYESLPAQFATFTEEKYEITLIEQDCVISVVSCEEPRVSVTITLTSVHMRDLTDKPDETSLNKLDDPPDVLDKQKCLEALANLRRAKWFQARCAPIRPCVIILRIMKDLCQRISTWSPFPFWALELLMEKIFMAANQPLTLAEAFRHLFETISSGILLECGPGILDPCEKDRTDALKAMSAQQREDITASAQHALRIIAFGQIYKILGVEKFPTNTTADNKMKISNSTGALTNKSHVTLDSRKRTLEPAQTEAKKVKIEPK